MMNPVHFLYLRTPLEDKSTKELTSWAQAQMKISEKDRLETFWASLLASTEAVELSLQGNPLSMWQVKYRIGLLNN